jgi:hypothetical protein
MDSPRPAMPIASPEAIEFVRFCYRRRRVGWPELYDEMCAVAGRAAFRGYAADDLAGIGISFCLGDMPGLAALVQTVVQEEQAARRPVAVRIVRDEGDGREAVDAGQDGARSVVPHLQAASAGA